MLAGKTNPGKEIGHLEVALELRFRLIRMEGDHSSTTYMHCKEVLLSRRPMVSPVQGTHKLNRDVLLLLRMICWIGSRWVT